MKKMYTRAVGTFILCAVATPVAGLKISRDKLSGAQLKALLRQGGGQSSWFWSRHYKKILLSILGVATLKLILNRVTSPSKKQKKEERERKVLAKLEELVREEALDEEALDEEAPDGEALNEEALNKGGLNKEALDEEGPDEEALNKGGPDEEALNKGGPDEEGPDEEGPDGEAQA